MIHTYSASSSSSAQSSWATAAGGTLEDRPAWISSNCFDPFPFPDATEPQRDRIRKLAEQLDAHRISVQAQHPDVTLTGMYNALQRAREAAAGGAPLTAKERAFHDRALIGVLRSIHDDLDAAVADAYGWPADLADDEILARLVNLNAARAAEEAAGKIRWLRPDFRRARAGVSASPQEQMAGVDVTPKLEAAPTAQPWPKDRFQQIKAVRGVLAARSGSHTAQEVAAAFKSAPLAAVTRHLDMLERIGVFVGYRDPPNRHWHASGL